MINTLRDDLATQWQSSRVLRLGSWAILIILLLYGVLWLDDTLSAQQLTWRTEATTLAEMQTMADQEYADRQLKFLEREREQMLAEAWEARTAGLAKARVREMLTRTSSDSSQPITLRRVEFTDPQPLDADVWEMRGQLNAVLDGTVVPWGWIANLETHRPGFVMNSLEIRLGNRTGVSMNIEFRVPLKGLEGSSP